MSARGVRRELLGHLPFVSAAIAVAVLSAFSTGAVTTFFAQDDITFLARAAQARLWAGLALSLNWCGVLPRLRVVRSQSNRVPPVEPGAARSDVAIALMISLSACVVLDYLRVIQQ
jgi:hypothetical protein